MQLKLVSLMLDAVVTSGLLGHMTVAYRFLAGLSSSG